MTQEDLRRDALRRWLESDLGLALDRFAPISGDASFRRYFRARAGDRSYIVMDAPPDREDAKRFVTVGRLLAGAGLNVPAVFEADFAQGFLLLSDFGNKRYADAAQEPSAASLYADALDALFRMQSRVDVASASLPRYDEGLLLRELDLFFEWFLAGLLGIEVTGRERGLERDLAGSLIASALEQPGVCVHRDYHSRNLMVVSGDNPGILDFQDALVGPVTYDLVSLARDCYVAWPEQRIALWVADFQRRLIASGVIEPVDEITFKRWFDWMGLQRHLKAIGIFSRLKLRDGKSAYLADIPRTLSYVLRVCSAYSELSEFHGFLQRNVTCKPDALGSFLK